MKHLYTFLAGFAIIGTTMFSSCSSSRSAAQTPDDIYYSPGGSKAVTGGSDKDEYYSTAPSDNYVRMKAQDPDRWSYFDDYNAYDSYYAPSGIGYGASYGFGYPSYGFGYGLGFGPSFGFGFGDPYLCWNNYFMWNSWYNPYFYNPYYGGGVLAYGHGVYNPGIYSHLRTFNTTGYGGGSVRNVTNSPSSRLYRPGMRSTTAYNSNLNNSGTRTVNRNGAYYRPGNTYRPVNNSYQPSTRSSFGSQPTRSFAPSGGGGGGGGFSRPGRH
ncbi:MAG TPA: hypothetical protein VGM30_03510 [Puia sp.]|jgi:hypothetical protein